MAKDFESGFPVVTGTREALRGLTGRPWDEIVVEVEGRSDLRLTTDQVLAKEAGQNQDRGEFALNYHHMNCPPGTGALRCITSAVSGRLSGLYLQNW